MRHSALLLALLWATACTGSKAGSSSSSTTTGGAGAGSTSTSAGSSSGTHGATGTTGGAATTGGSSGAGSSSGATSGGGSSTGTPGALLLGGLFPSSMPWYQDITGAANLSPDSNAIITDLNDNGGWGNSNTFQIDFSITLQRATANTEYVQWTPSGDWYDPDCDNQPMPAPVGGALEGENGYACAGDGDCHLLVIDDNSHKLYEMWRANQVSANSWEGGCQAVWDLAKQYPDNLRGDQCTSADAAGFPISALLFTADEVAAGHIDHAIRFILPNDRIRHGEYVHPSTHSTNPTAGGPNAPPYGVRLRLRADYPVQNLPAGAQVVARALQKYGMLLSDGGQIALTAADDRFTVAKWSGLLDAHDLSALAVTDFEVVKFDTPIAYTGDCVRNP